MTLRPISLLLLLIIGFVPLVSAEDLTLNGPGSLAPYAPFTIHATLPPIDAFTSANVTLDGAVVATCYPTGACFIPAEHAGEVSYGIKDTQPNGTGGLILLLSHRGLNVGTHTIRVSTDGTTDEEASLEIQVDEALDAETVRAIQANQVDVENRLLQTEEKINEYEQTIASLQSQIEQEGQARSELSDQLNTAKGNLASAQQTITELTAQLSNVQGELGQTIKNPFASNPTPENPAPEAVSSAPVTGFATGSNAPLIGIGVLIGVALLAFYFIRGRTSGKGFGGSGGSPLASKAPFFEGSMDSLFKGLPGGSSSDKPDAQPKKWSSDEAGLRADVENNPPEKINFGDLVKQERD